jgi:PHP family Zn ribbon phosphoesterase
LWNNLSPVIDKVCITDHGLICEDLRLQPHKHQILYGCELTYPLELFGKQKVDIVVFGIPYIPAGLLTLREIIDFVHNCQGIVIAAHPFSSRAHCFQENLSEYPIDAIELNGGVSPKSRKKSMEFAQMMHLPTVGGSDAHSVSQLNSIATEFTTPIYTISQMIQAIKSKKCRAITIK